MCGISGAVAKNNNINSSYISKLIQSLNHRGPDSYGFYILGNIGLCHNRLSIIDLDSGSQPMVSSCGNFIIVFNGEIYNYKTLREILISKGLEFKTTSDTEVILNGYKYWGLRVLLDNIEGMFSFALYDKKKDELYIARDRFGEKPLYYLNNDDFFMFSSELKSLTHFFNQKKIDKFALNLFFALNYIPAPYTIYDGIYKLRPGHFIKINKESEIIIEKYYDIKDKINNNPNYDFDSARKTLRSLLKRSVVERLNSDVPVGTFLSGGIDSSIITILASEEKKKLNTFSIGFNEKEYDETERALLISKEIDSNHNCFTLDYSNAIKYIDEIILHFDEPFGDSSAIPTFFVSKNASKYVKVVLTGDCADELFAGYEKYLGIYYADKFKKLPAFIRNIIEKSIYKIPHTSYTNSLLRKAKKVINNSNLDNFDLMFNLMNQGFNESERLELLNNEFYTEIKSFIANSFFESNIEGDLNKTLYTDLRIVLEGNMLVKVDRMTMKNSLEARIPFLKKDLVEFALNLPEKFKLNGKNKKFILKEAFKDILPEKTLKFSKKGFGAPIDYWIKNELRNEFLEKQNLFNKNYIQKLFSEHIQGQNNNINKLWNFYVFQKWYKYNFN